MSARVNLFMCLFRIMQSINSTRQSLAASSRIFKSSLFSMTNSSEVEFRILYNLFRQPKTRICGFLVLDDLELDISLEAEVSGIFCRAMMDVDQVHESCVHRILDEEDLR